MILTVLSLVFAACGPKGEDGEVQARGAAAKPTLATLTPSLTALAIELGAQAHLVGVSQHGPRPAGVPVVAGMRPNMELLLHHRPDIVAVGKFPYNVGDIQMMRRSGLNVVARGLVSLDDLRHWAKELGVLLDVQERARGFVERLDASLTRAAKSRLRGRNLRILLVYGRSGGSFFSTGGGDHITDLLNVLGATNVAAGGPVTVRLSLERIVHLAPDTILHIAPDPELPTSAAALDFWRRAAPTVPAVKRGRVLAFSDDRLALNGPALVEGFDALVSALEALAQ